MKIKRKSWLIGAVNIAGWIPLIIISLLYFANQLTADPIRRAIQLTGDVAITFLILTLACSPINTVTGCTPVLTLKRPLGLFTFLYAAVHFTLFIGLDYGFNVAYILEAIKGNGFIWLGLSALVILLLLTVLSFTHHSNKPPLVWNWLHRLIYLAGILAVVHFSMALKGNVFKLKGDFVRPFISAAVIVFLLLLRLPIVETWFVRFRTRTK
jgi:methionine sulfoxide reductase heme-binding subunit